jgi:hypothetical protein
MKLRRESESWREEFVRNSDNIAASKAGPKPEKVLMDLTICTIPPEALKALNWCREFVRAIVEGSVLRMGNRTRITAQLIHARRDTHLWAENYDRDLKRNSGSPG